MTQTVSKEEMIQEMMAKWPHFVRDITNMIEDLNCPEVTKWVEKVSHY
jgi:hypothetical protein